jgi:cytosine deaminase
MERPLVKKGANSPQKEYIVIMTNSKHQTLFYKQFRSRVTELGGMFNAHLHLDRAGTLDEYYWENTDVNISEISCVALLEKHAMISGLHSGPAYQEGDLKKRVNEYLDTMIAVNTFRAETFVDVTPDNVGLSAIKTMHEIKLARANEIDLRLGAYSPLGYTDDQPEHWELLIEGAQYADFIGSLPEADDKADYPAHIGFYEHCKRMLLLGKELGKEIHVHVDQRNEPSENGTEQLIRAVKEVGALTSENGEPTVWAVHVISPSTYEENRFDDLVQGLVAQNIGVISSPSAAIGMRQLRPLMSPTYNSITRILEMLAAGVHVRLGSDNMADICSPSTTADLTDEIFMLSAALRFYHINTLARLAVGQKLNEQERNFVKKHLSRNDIEITNTINGLKNR